MKLVFHRASMQKYYDSIKSTEYSKLYLETNDNTSKLDKYIKTNNIDQIRFFNPIEKELIKMIMENKIINQVEKLVFPSPYFLNSTNFDKNKKINDELGGLRHDLFYKSQRIEYNIMVKKSKSGSNYIPDGLKWSFDTENRSPFEKTQKEPANLNLKSKKDKNI